MNMRRKNSCTHIYTHTHTCMHACAHTHAHVHACIHACTRPNTHMTRQFSNQPFPSHAICCGNCVALGETAMTFYNPVLEDWVETVVVFPFLTYLACYNGAFTYLPHFSIHQTPKQHNKTTQPKADRCPASHFLPLNCGFSVAHHITVV